jgi:hypothetical protein
MGRFSATTFPAFPHFSDRLSCSITTTCHMPETKGKTLEEIERELVD